MVNKNIKILLILFISSCNFKHKDSSCQEEQTIVSRYNNGAINTVSMVNCIDTALTKTISFYENGDTSEINNKRNGKLEGQTRLFYQSGKLHTIVFFKDDIADSSWTWDDKNGLNKFVQVFTRFPSQCASLVYNDHGVLERYAYVIKEKIIMNVAYSSNGAITSVDGDYATAIIGNKKEYNVGDSMTLNFYVATPPNDSVKFSAGLYYEGDLDSLHVDEMPIKNSRVTISSILRKTGKYCIRFDILATHKLGNLKAIHTNRVFRLDVK